MPDKDIEAIALVLKKDIEALSLLLKAAHDHNKYTPKSSKVPIPCSVFAVLEHDESNRMSGSGGLLVAEVYCSDGRIYLFRLMWNSSVGSIYTEPEYEEELTWQRIRLPYPIHERLRKLCDWIERILVESKLRIRHPFSRIRLWDWGKRGSTSPIRQQGTKYGK